MSLVSIVNILNVGTHENCLGDTIIFSILYKSSTTEIGKVLLIKVLCELA